MVKNFNSLEEAENHVLSTKVEVLARQTFDAQREFDEYFVELLRGGDFDPTSLIVGMACALASKCEQYGQDFAVILEKSAAIATLAKETGEN